MPWERGTQASGVRIVEWKELRTSLSLWEVLDHVTMWKVGWQVLFCLDWRHMGKKMDFDSAVWTEFVLSISFCHKSRMHYSWFIADFDGCNMDSTDNSKEEDESPDEESDLEWMAPSPMRCKTAQHKALSALCQLGKYPTFVDKFTLMIVVPWTICCCVDWLHFSSWLVWKQTYPLQVFQVSVMSQKLRWGLDFSNSNGVKCIIKLLSTNCFIDRIITHCRLDSAHCGATSILYITQACQLLVGKVKPFLDTLTCTFLTCYSPG